MLGAKANEDLVTAIAAGTDKFVKTKASKKRKRNVNERSKRKIADFLKRATLCIVFRGEPLRAASGGNSVRGEVRRNK